MTIKDRRNMAAIAHRIALQRLAQLHQEAFRSLYAEALGEVNRRYLAAMRVQKHALQLGVITEVVTINMTSMEPVAVAV